MSDLRQTRNGDDRGEKAQTIGLSEQSSGCVVDRKVLKLVDKLLGLSSNKIRR